MLWRNHRPSRLTIEPEVAAESAGAHLLAVTTHQLIAEAHGPASRILDGSTDQNLVVVAVGRAIAAVDLDHHQEESAFLDFPIGESGLPAEIRAADFVPDDVVGMMGDAH